jgi:hypothetical protein
MRDIKRGTVFTIPLDDDHFSYGQIIKKRFPIYYMVAYNIKTSINIELEVVINTEILFLGNFFDALLRNGRWTVVGVIEPPCERIPYPKHKVFVNGRYCVEAWDFSERRWATDEEVELLENSTSVAPIRLENAIKAHFGYRLWDHDAFDFLLYNHVLLSSKITI